MLVHTHNVRKKPKSRTLRTRRRVVLGFIFTVTIFLGIISLLNGEWISIQGIRVEGVSALNPKDIEQTVRLELDQKMLLLVPRDTVITIPRTLIQTSLLKAYPRIETLDLELYEKTLVITVTEHVPYALACMRTNEEIPRTRSCFYMTESGYVFDRAPFFSHDVFFTYLMSDSHIIPGHSLIDEGSLSHMTEIHHGLETIGVVARSAMPNENHIDVSYNIASINKLLLRKPFIIYTSYRISPEATLSLISTILHDQTFADRLAKGNNPEYLDLRFENKILYRFYGDE